MGTHAFLTLAQAARLFPSSKGDIGTHPATLTRWITTGTKVADGRLIRLKATRFPSGWRVTEEDVETFLSRLTSAALGEPDAGIEVEEPAAPTKVRRRELARVDAALDAAGI